VEVFRFCQLAPEGTSLTDAAHWFELCSPVVLELLVLLRFSSRSRWLLVPRTSSTPVATWSWPTWEVELETCFGSHVHFVGVSISFEKNFYWLSFTPLSSRQIGPSSGIKAGSGLH
jgi:hypothetical protein